MGMQVRVSYSRFYCSATPAPRIAPSTPLRFSFPFKIPGIPGISETRNTRRNFNRSRPGIVVSSSSNLATSVWDGWMPEKGSSVPSLSDILWPAAGAFAAMALLGKMDQMLAPKGVSMTIAPFGAVCAVLFSAPSSPAARKYNVFMAQIGCAAIGVLAFTIFGPGWLARSSALAASVAFMIYTRSTHPPAASLPILFIDGVKLHHLNFWYALFPGAAGCIILCLIGGGMDSFLMQQLCQWFLLWLGLACLLPES